MRLIDADVLIDKTDDKYSLGEIGRRERDDIVYALEFAPTVDAVEVVRCKECEWSDWYETSSGEHRCYCMEHGSSGHTDDDYCSYGERRE